MLAIRTGDESAFEELFGRHIDALFRYALRLTASPAAADDLTQEAWLTVWNKAHSFKPKKATFRTWLFRILHNKFIDGVRRNRFETPVDPDQANQERAYTPDENDERLREQLFTALSTLPEQQRAAILLAHAQGFGNKDIAQILGTTVRATESLLARARRSLKAEFGGSNNE